MKSRRWRLARNYTVIALGTVLISVAFTNCAKFEAVDNSTQNFGSSQAPYVPPIEVGDPQVPSQDPAGIFDGKGGVNAANYKLMASKMGTAAMIDFKFGKDSTYYNPAGVTAPTWFQPTIKFFDQPPGNAAKVYYQLGSPNPSNDPGDYSSNEAQVAYVTDSTVAKSKPGIDRIATLQMGTGIFSSVPQLYWNYGGGGAPDPNFDPYTASGKAQLAQVGGIPSQPVDMARAYGASEHAAQSLMVFQNGTIATGGVATASYSYFYKPFPANLVPTAVSVTGHGEFALITLWDTQNMKSKLAVIALGGFIPPGEFWDYEWTELYMGFRNYSLWRSMKLLGYVDLPGMIAPTGVEAVGDKLVGNDGANWLPGQKNPAKFPLSERANWECFKSDPACWYNQHGFALVSSRYEKKVLVVDLNPLFQSVKKELFTDYDQFRANVANTGMADNQYPRAFAVSPSSMPQVVASISFDQQVTAISASLATNNEALIATEDGTVTIYNVDGLQTGTGPGKSITKLRSFTGGRNITRIAHMKHGDPTKDILNTYILVSRGDKRFDWIDTKNNKTLRTLRDSRLNDPISAEDNNNHGTESLLITVADYGAKKVRTYRYGMVIFWTNGGIKFGMGINGTDEYEYSGDYTTPTGPFCIMIENVT